MDSDARQRSAAVQATCRGHFLILRCWRRRNIHVVLDQRHLDGIQPQITAAAEAILRESSSPYTLPALISALEAISQLIRRVRNATAHISPPRP